MPETASPSKSQTLPPVHNPNSPNPNAPIFRPSPARATSLTGAPFQYKTRAASQPAGERIPPSSSTPVSGRGSPGVNGNGNGNGAGSAYGVIGGARTPGRFSTALAGGNGTQTRANSFTAGEVREPRNMMLNRTLSSHTEEFVPSRSQSTSPFPTFSPNSTPSTSPAAIRQNPLPPSPPKAGTNISRSRSQSLATGVRPSHIDRPWLGPMSNLENVGAFSKIDSGWLKSPNEGSNMSPFSRGLPSLGNNPAREEVYGRNGMVSSSSRFKTIQEGFNTRGWGSSAPEQNSSTSALSSSVHRALGGGGSAYDPTFSNGGHGEYNANSNGNRSGTSSRRHSVSVVSGPGGRREFAFGEPGMGLSSISPPSASNFRGLFGFEGDLSNALSLNIEQAKSRKTGDVEPFGSASLPQFGLDERFPHEGHQRIPSINRSRNDEIFPSFGSTPPRGRLDTFAATGDRERATSGESTSNSKRFPLDSAALGSPVIGAERALNGNANGLNGAVTGSPEGIKEVLPRMQNGPGIIGTPLMGGGHGQGLPPPPFVPGQAYSSNPRSFGNAPLSSSGPLGPSSGLGLMNSGSPGLIGPPGAFGRPPIGVGPGPGYSGFYGRPPPPGGASAFSPQLGFGGHSLPPQGGFTSPPPGHYPPQGLPQGPYGYYGGPPSPQQPQQTSPSFSQLSLADLGKGISLNDLAPNTPLYIVTFKAGRRDVFYCTDPTLLITNGDRVIVEADRGSDLGTVIYDLTPTDIRDWQERQATAALLSGASQHQPPGLSLSLSGQGQGQQPNLSQPGGGKDTQTKKRTSGEFEYSNADLDGLLAGCGPSGQPDLNGNGSTIVRGPLAKDILPKRIFAKAAQTIEEQNRMREKANDEHEALMICREKVIQRGLPMHIVDAEYQWDRRKLTFYFKADKRVDFRDLTKENFRIFKSRIWMSMVPKDARMLIIMTHRSEELKWILMGINKLTQDVQEGR
ncbi:uncharacterized protein I303_105861 [Kwoniella dejecticola CBS 10117]|uniref:PSP1 C-terminal domain-containing protein n=1 Tax=Kwoniella dejecticola CBS 10117 TaxID=1296121 RepID=A0A1A6A0K5_9TREE|nr:uncharacterized protein I303_05882 [Kwoniella dejecticola CBS 10117]OBR83602.1 hypothetical protein I303_05882 [Kwoniella dejecticola CBS 10117]